MLWRELEDRVYKIITNIDLTNREKAELILIEFNQYEPTAKSLDGVKQPSYRGGTGYVDSLPKYN